jgi:ribosomal protein S18 acetylase RimI-like enzyme
MNREDKPESSNLNFRFANTTDSRAVASLHADSWRRHYRGAYSDSFLDDEVFNDRQAVWAERFSQRRQDRFTILAEIDNVVIGFVYVVLDRDPRWGALLDNLHVAFSFKRRGVGTGLLVQAVKTLIEQRPDDRRFHLWVLDQNRAAQSFYTAHGGMRVETTVLGPFPGGGTALGHRIAWPDAGLLLSQP